ADAPLSVTSLDRKSELLSVYAPGGRVMTSGPSSAAACWTAARIVVHVPAMHEPAPSALPVTVRFAACAGAAAASVASPAASNIRARIAGATLRGGGGARQRFFTAV